MWPVIKSKLFPAKEGKIDCLVVGLGNPSLKYKKTAHNAGFRVVNLLREQTDLPALAKDNTLNSLTTKGFLKEKKVALLLPLTFMNLSGEAVRKAVKRFNISPEKMILVHDDIDLPLGTIRFSFSRSSAGHKGVSSVIKALGTKEFARLRIGIGKEEKRKAREVVLQGLPPLMKRVEDTAAKELQECVLFGFSAKTMKVEKEKTKDN